MMKELFPHDFENVSVLVDICDAVTRKTLVQARSKASAMRIDVDAPGYVMEITLPPIFVTPTVVQPAPVKPKHSDAYVEALRRQIAALRGLVEVYERERGDE